MAGDFYESFLNSQLFNVTEHLKHHDPNTLYVEHSDKFTIAEWCASLNAPI